MPADEQPAPRAATRADVARLSGVSTAVVSYVLNDGPRPVAERTREKVLAAVRALNYRPNAAARALSKGRADSVGLLVSDNRNPFFAELIHAIDRTARDRGESSIVISTENGSQTLVEHMDDLAAQRVRGVISVHRATAGDRSRIAALGLPTVLINQIEPQEGLHTVRVDYRAGARDAVNHLIAHGCRRIGFVGADEGARAREHGWADALTDAGFALPRTILTEFSLAGGYRAGSIVADAPQRPDALFVASDQMAMGVLAALHDAGLHVPDDIALVAFDGTRESAYYSPALTTVRQPLEDIARAALDALLDDDERTDTVVATSLVIRASCGCDGPRAA